MAVEFDKDADMDVHRNGVVGMADEISNGDVMGP